MKIVILYCKLMVFAFLEAKITSIVLKWNVAMVDVQSTHMSGQGEGKTEEDCCSEFGVEVVHHFMNLSNIEIHNMSDKA